MKSIKDYIDIKKNAIKELDLSKLFIDRVFEFYFDIDSNKICSFELILFILKHYYSSFCKTSLFHLKLIHPNFSYFFLHNLLFLTIFYKLL